MTTSVKKEKVAFEFISKKTKNFFLSTREASTHFFLFLAISPAELLILITYTALPHVCKFYTSIGRHSLKNAKFTVLYGYETNLSTSYMRMSSKLCNFLLLNSIIDVTQ